MINNAAQYMGDGPGELHDNVTANLGGHLLGASIQGVSGPSSFSPAPGHGYEDEPVDAAERASQQTAQNAYRSTNGELSSGSQGI
jgi:hypothetical protein